MSLVLLYIISWMLPVVLVAFLFRSLGVIVEGLRALNMSSLRIAAAVEKLAAAEDRRDQLA
ncbi:MAG TPA: hypothetical protein VMY34_06860 [Acidimicrobiales bacterium]|nr:hypothetical protein [Acidimicrobiales bacterium]